MRKLLPTALLSIAGMAVIGLVGMSAPVVASSADEAAKREDDAPSLVLVADDEPLIVEGVRTVLESAGDITVAATAHDGREALAAAEGVDVVLVDLNMPIKELQKTL